MGRIAVNFNSGWRFQKLTQKDGLSELAIETAGFDDSAWENISLPHTWNTIDGADGRTGINEGGEHYYRGLGGYRKAYIFPEEVSGKRIFMEFKGANTVTDLYVNEKFVGRHEGGYSAFRFDITELVKFDKENFFAVKVNNAPTEYIAPITDQGDFTKMGGIYRDVNLIAVEPVHINLTDYGSSGVYITPQNIAEKHSDIDILIKLANEGTEQKAATANVEILDMDGNIVAVKSMDTVVAAKSKAAATLSIPIENPIFWDGIHNPYLYRAKVTLLADGVEQDGITQNFGIRTYHFDADEGFFLNGRYLDLRGVNYHQDSFENGWAMTNEQRDRDYGLMLDMGVTAVRMAHYQHDSYEYDLCDRLGITVWTEIGIVNKMSPDETDALTIAGGFAENVKQQLTELIRQNYNHPSVIVWGISNELHQMSNEIFALYAELSELAKAEDTTRKTTYADNQFYGRFMEFSTDVVGYNRYYGWYLDAGDGEFGKWLDSYHGLREKRPIAVSEYGGGGAVSQHKDNIIWSEDIDSWGERHYENYQSTLHEDIWVQFSQRKYLWGKYVWCMFDFASDGREEGDTKGLNDKGLMTRERKPKDAFYFYKSVWNEKPMLHLTEKRYTERPNLIPQVKAYSNAEKVELFVNEKSFGGINRTELAPGRSTVFVWKNVEIKKGEENKIWVAATFSDGLTLEDSAVWNGC